MGKNYKQLRLEDRDRITEMMAEGRSITEIAEVLGGTSPLFRGKSNCYDSVTFDVELKSATV